eukprot:scaffold57175_cov35-Tisochrysis_lutea.AAC.1
MDAQRYTGGLTLPIEPRLMPSDTLRSHRKWSKPSARRSRATSETWLESCTQRSAGPHPGERAWLRMGRYGRRRERADERAP